MKGSITAIVLAATVLLFVVTNPTLDDYEDYLRQELAREAREEDEVAGALVALLGGFAGSLLANATTRDNYLLFSVYATDLDTEGLLVLGILGNFLVLRDGEN
jgi:hypothetical protein